MLPPPGPIVRTAVEYTRDISEVCSGYAGSLRVTIMMAGDHAHLAVFAGFVRRIDWLADRELGVAFVLPL